MKSAAFVACRVASVAMTCTRSTRIARAIAAKRPMASTACAIASSESRPVASRPAPSAQNDFSLKRGNGARLRSS